MKSNEPETIVEKIQKLTILHSELGLEIKYSAEPDKVYVTNETNSVLNVLQANSFHVVTDRYLLTLSINNYTKNYFESDTILIIPPTLTTEQTYLLFRDALLSIVNTMIFNTKDETQESLKNLLTDIKEVFHD